eukprot:6178304-Pleurochrysis_carterae.AAC.4
MRRRRLALSYSRVTNVNGCRFRQHLLSSEALCMLTFGDVRPLFHSESFARSSLSARAVRRRSSI